MRQLRLRGFLPKSSLGVRLTFKRCDALLCQGEVNFNSGLEFSELLYGLFFPSVKFEKSKSNADELWHPLL